MDKVPSSPTGSAAFGKGLAVLGLILRDRGRSRIVDLVADLGLPRSTLHRFLGHLLDQGLIARVGRGRYDVGMALAEAAPAISAKEQLARLARPLLARLVKSCGLTAHLGVFENDMVTYLVKSPARRSAVGFTRENGQLEAYCSGIGKVLLAHLPDDALERYLEAGAFVPLTERTITDPLRLRDCLADVRRQGWAADDGEIAEGLRCLAVPVTGRSGRVAAAISVSIAGQDSFAGDDASLLNQMRDCAAQIGTSLRDPA